MIIDDETVLDGLGDASEKAIMLTTIDNPFNPFDDFESWFVWDVTHGHNTCGYLARIARTSDALSDTENSYEIRRAIDEILRYDYEKKYKIVEQEKDS